MKKLGKLILMLTLVLFFAGCSSQEEPDTRNRPVEEIQGEDQKDMDDGEDDMDDDDETKDVSPRYFFTS
ncbi:MAG: hypothetical protein Q4G11_00400 [Gallicola sp.]|nr:hypothetical protein [Gallicola sp.]